MIHNTVTHSTIEVSIMAAQPLIEVSIMTTPPLVDAPSDPAGPVPVSGAPEWAVKMEQRALRRDMQLRLQLKLL